MKAAEKRRLLLGTLTSINDKGNGAVTVDLFNTMNNELKSTGNQCITPDDFNLIVDRLRIEYEAFKETNSEFLWISKNGREELERLNETLQGS